MKKGKVISHNGEPPKTVILPLRPIDLDIWAVLKRLHVASTEERRSIKWEVRTSDIRANMHKPCQKLTIRRGLKRLEKAGLIKLFYPGYNRWQFSIERWDV
jgi:hypothetical protein